MLSVSAMRMRTSLCLAWCVLVALGIALPGHGSLLPTTGPFTPVNTTTLTAPLGDEPLPTPQWTRQGCTPPFTECARVSVFADWDQRNEERLSFFVERLLADPVSAVTVWIVSDSTDTLNLVEHLRKTGVNVVRFHPRGGKHSDPQLVCSEDAVSVTKNCWPDAVCAQQLRNKGVKLVRFSIAQAARDLQWVLSSFGRGTHNVLLAEGVSSAVVTHYLLLFPHEATSDLGVVFVNPVYPGLAKEAFDHAAAFYRHVDASAQHVLTLCDAQPLCAARLGVDGSAWARLQNVQQAIASGALPCVKDKKLRWTASDGSTNQARAVREALAAMVSPYQFFVPLHADLIALVPSVLYRMQRCSDSDVRALNHLHDYLQGGAHVSECPANTPLYMSWLSNEFRNHTKLMSTPQSILDAAVDDLDLTLVPGHRDMTNFFLFDETVEHYNPPPHLWSGLYQGYPQVLLLTADVDAIFPSGHSAKLTQRFAQITAHQLRGGGAGHLPSNHAMQKCLTNHLHQYTRTFTWGSADLCVLNEPGDIDFVSVDATRFYGVADAWEFTVPHADEPRHGKARGEDDDDGTRRTRHIKEATMIVAALCFVALLLAGGWYAWQWYIHRRYAAAAHSDDLFDYLH